MNISFIARFILSIIVKEFDANIVISIFCDVSIKNVVVNMHVVHALFVIKYKYIIHGVLLSIVGVTLFRYKSNANIFISKLSFFSLHCESTNQ